MQSYRALPVQRSCHFESVDGQLKYAYFLDLSVDRQFVAWQSP